MNKTRLEALSDGIFAIVMTLLAIEIKIPELHHTTNEELFSELGKLTPIFLSYFLSFAFLGTTWVFHHFLFTVMAKNIDRRLMYLNILLLSVISLIPFSSHLLGTYPNLPVGVATYAVHVLIITIFFTLLQVFIYKSRTIENNEIDRKDAFYRTVRITQNISLPFIALFVAFINTQIAIVLLLVPIIVNAIPGLLGWILQYSGLEKAFYKEEEKKS